jgi:hypothetical protein
LLPPVPFYNENTAIPLYGSWAGPKARLDAVEGIQTCLPCRDLRRDAWVVRPPAEVEDIECGYISSQKDISEDFTYYKTVCKI